MSSGMMETIVVTVCTIGAQSGGQSFTINTAIVITTASSGQFNASRFAHYMDHIQGTVNLQDNMEN